MARPEVTGRRVGRPRKDQSGDTAAAIAAAKGKVEGNLSLVTPKSQAPHRHHLDKRADRLIAESDGDDEDLLTTTATAEWLAVSVEWLEIGRAKKYGPPFTRLSSRLIRYRRADVLEWLKARTHQSTSEYASPAA